MFELYTNVNLILIELECIENRNYRRNERAEAMLIIMSDDLGLDFYHRHSKSERPKKILVR